MGWKDLQNVTLAPKAIVQICWPGAITSPLQTFQIQAQSSVSTGTHYAVVGPAEGGARHPGLQRRRWARCVNLRSLRLQGKELMLSKLRTELCIADERHEELRQRLDAGEERPWVKCGP